MTRLSKGFTMVELMLAMVFTSILLLSITITAIQAGKIYNRGIVLQSVNQSGRDISDMIRRDVLQSRYRADLTVITSQEGDIQSGRFCVDRYAYLWNSAATLHGYKGVYNAAIIYGPDDQPINFVRVIDEDGSLCQKTDGRYPNKLTDAAKVTALLKHRTDKTEVVLAIHDLKIEPLTKDGENEGLYRIHYIIGTSEIDEINTTDQSCRPPNEDKANSTFCAINQFEMIVRSNG